MKRIGLLLAFVGLGAVLAARAAGDPSGAPNARVRVQLEPGSRPSTLRQRVAQGLAGDPDLELVVFQPEVVVSVIGSRTVGPGKLDGKSLATYAAELEVRVLGQNAAVVPGMPRSVYEVAEDARVWQQLGAEIVSNAQTAIWLALERLRPDRPRLGCEWRSLSKKDRERLGLAKKGDGLLVVSVAPGSPAAEAGLQADDVIRSAHLPGESKPVTKPDRIEAATVWTHPPGYSFEVEVERAGQTRHVTLVLLPPSRWQAPPPRP